MFRNLSMYYPKLDEPEDTTFNPHKKPFLKRRTGLVQLMHRIENAQANVRASYTPPPQFHGGLQDNCRGVGLGGELQRYSRSASLTSKLPLNHNPSYTRQGSLTRETTHPQPERLKHDPLPCHTSLGARLQDRSLYSENIPPQKLGSVYALKNNNSIRHNQNYYINNKDFGMGGESYLDNPGFNSEPMISSPKDLQATNLMEQQSKIIKPGSVTPPNKSSQYESINMDKYETLSARSLINRGSYRRSNSNSRPFESNSSQDGRNALLKPTKHLTKRNSINNKNKFTNFHTVHSSYTPNTYHRRNPKFSLSQQSQKSLQDLNIKNHDFFSYSPPRPNPGSSILKRNASLIRTTENRSKIDNRPPISPSLLSIDTLSSRQSTTASVSNHLKDEDGNIGTYSYPRDILNRASKIAMKPTQEKAKNKTSFVPFVVSILLILILLRVCFHINGRLIIDHDI